ncbi:MAG: DUF6101 family protein [Pseudolabrys sp.]|nr:DUF6101 family protein [Pseudolabrys sp.]
MRSGGCPAGSSRLQRLDPFALPLAFAANDAAADGRVRHIELFHERLVIRRSVAGMHMALNMPLSAFAGVAIRLDAGENGELPTVAVVLEHKDPGLALPLFVSTEADDAFAEWQSWSKVLGVPQLVADDEGGWREPFARIGGVRIERVRPRRRRHSSLKRRRPSMALRRKGGKLTPNAAVYHGEREIIARN